MIAHHPRSLNIAPLRASRWHSVRGGFTLVELLVAVGLVALMMSLFAGVFQIASATMAKQKGIAENDQRARSLVTVLRNDLRYRTFQYLAPFGAPGSGPGSTAVPLDTQNTYTLNNILKREGYFYISENAVNDDTDDVLQFTVNFKDSPDPNLFGKAVALADGGGNTNDANQPEFDDLRFDTNGVGQTTKAEVSYFVRRGVLYRRVLLIRDVADGTPRDATNNPLITTPYEAGGATRNFWTDFDYSANYDPNGTGKPAFHGTDTLNNLVGSKPTVSNVISLGIPHFRFGHNHSTGLPAEFVNGSGTSQYIGRYLHFETSSPNFGYPGRVTAGSPDPTAQSVLNTLQLNADKVVSAYANGTRIMDDMLLTNVHAFDVKVWDPAADVGPDGQPGKAGVDDDSNGLTDTNTLPAPNGPLELGELGWPGSDDGKFVDVGHSGSIGFYRGSIGDTNNIGYSPLGNSKFDTWHPNTTEIGNTPFRPVLDGKVQPLKAIQIKIRFYDITSTQMREVTIVQSLTSAP